MYFLGYIRIHAGYSGIQFKRKPPQISEETPPNPMARPPSAHPLACLYLSIYLPVSCYLPSYHLFALPESDFREILFEIWAALHSAEISRQFGGGDHKAVFREKTRFHVGAGSQGRVIPPRPGRLKKKKSPNRTSQYN